MRGTKGRHRGKVQGISASLHQKISGALEDGTVCGPQCARGGGNRSSPGCSLTPQREWVAILSLNGARLHTTTRGSLHFPGKTNCLTDASISEPKYKMGRVIFKLGKQSWQLERQLRDDANNLGGGPFRLPPTLSLWGSILPVRATRRRRAQTQPRGSQSSCQRG